jgi:hypothetical protein
MREVCKERTGSADPAASVSVVAISAGRFGVELDHRGRRSDRPLYSRVATGRIGRKGR